MKTLARQEEHSGRPAPPAGPWRALSLSVSAALLAVVLTATGASQTITDFPISSGFLPKGITTSPDGNLWFTGYNSIGRITPSGVITTFVTPHYRNVAIASGPDGNLWYTATSDPVDFVGRITPSGVITEFALDPDPFGTGYHTLSGITAGPDGNLWFAENPFSYPTFPFGNIGRIAPSGQITHFSVPSAPTLISDIVNGPDGNLWFTESGANKIGRITTAGAVTEFSVPTPASNPLFIAAGPDGNVWFTESAVAQIGRITPAGVITEFPFPPGSPIFGYSLNAITAGPDGNLWFTEFLGSTVGRITTEGVITEFPFPTFRVPYGITTGPDGNLWLTEDGATVGSPDLIGRFTLPAESPPPAVSFYTLAPCRVIDTRGPSGSYGGPALLSQSVRGVVLAGRCGIPSGATSVAVNIAVTEASQGPGFLTLYPGGAARPLASSLNFLAGQTRANNAVLRLSSGGALSVYCGQGAGTTHFILDVTGYFK
jgi:streptogramin lyase